MKGLISQVAGADEAMTTRIAATFTNLVKLADFSAPSKTSKEEEQPPAEETPEEVPGGGGRPGGDRHAKSLRPEFHYNIQIHLPANGTEDTYLNIFNAMRKVFQ